MFLLKNQEQKRTLAKLQTSALQQDSIGWHLHSGFGSVLLSLALVLVRLRRRRPLLLLVLLLPATAAATTTTTSEHEP